MNDAPALTVTEILATVTSCLLGHGYREVDSARLGEAAEEGRFFEDAYGVVGVSVYETWGDLAGRWQDAQGDLVRLISEYISKAEAKAWDGYLVLLTPAVSTAGREGVDQIRYDTSRLRKLVADGEELGSLGEIEDVLLPLLPLDPVIPALAEGSALDLLPELLEGRGIAPTSTARLLDAYTAGEPLVEGLHELGEAE
jgi:hypothetical protein